MDMSKFKLPPNPIKQWEDKDPRKTFEQGQKSVLEAIKPEIERLEKENRELKHLYDEHPKLTN